MACIPNVLPTPDYLHPNQVLFETGAMRAKDVAGDDGTGFPARYDLLSPIGIRRIAEACGEGAIKYSVNNWRKGIPVSVCINHVLAHVFAYMRGDRKEDHLAHAAWNLIACMHYEETKPEMFDIKIDDYKSPAS